MQHRSLAIAILTLLLAACSGGTDAVPPAETVPTSAPAAVATGNPSVGNAYASSDPGVPVDVTASASPDAAGSDAASPSPSPAVSPSPSARPSPTATPTPTPTPTPSPKTVLSDLVATVTSRSHNSVLLQHFTCTITVRNDSSVQRTGKIKVTFVHDATPEAGSTPPSQDVTVPANASITVTFTDPVFHPLSEDVAVFTTTDAYTGP